MSEFVRVTDQYGIIYVRNGHIDGEIYSDGEVWADREQLERAREQQAFVNSGVRPDAPT